MESKNYSLRALALLHIFIFIAPEVISAVHLARKLKIQKYEFDYLLTANRNVDLESLKFENNHSESVKKENKVQESSKFVMSTSPKQAENGGFTVSSTDALVNKFTGDFNYAVPLVNVEGFPISLNYNSAIGMNSEASWVGLGWNLDLGSVNREMRGIPDDFNGTDDIVRFHKEKQEDLEGRKLGIFGGVSYNVGFTTGSKIIFKPGLQFTALNGKYESNILGMGYTKDRGLQVEFNLGQDKDISAGYVDAGPFSSALSFGYGYSKDSKRGIGTNKSFGISGGFSSLISGGLGLSYGNSFSSRAGMLEKEWSVSTDAGLGKPGNSQLTAGWSFSSYAPYGSQTSIPKVNYNSLSESFQFNLKLFVGGELKGVQAKIGAQLQKYNTQTFMDVEANKIVQPAYGYLHSGKRYDFKVEGEYPVMDYERPRDFEYSTEMKHLPFSYQTHDMFVVGAFGTGGTFRSSRTDFGTYYDPTSKAQHNKASPMDLEWMPDWVPDKIVDKVTQAIDAIDVADVNAGILFSPPQAILVVGLGIGSQDGDKESGLWENNSNSNNLNFNPNSESNKFDNSTYFKMIGELTPNDMTAWNQLGGNTPNFYNVTKQGNDEIVLNQSLNVGGTPGNPSNSKPITANYFAPQLAENVNLPIIKSYDQFKSLTNNSITNISRSGGIRKGNHISQIDVVSTDGGKYTFGLPVYSIAEVEGAFSTGNAGGSANGAPLSHSSSTNLVTYDVTDNSLANDRGMSSYYDRSEMPSYATTFLITEMKSSDYIDKYGDGPSVDDVGTSFKFNYTLLGKSGSNGGKFKWRFPISGNQGSSLKAFHSEGFQGSSLDNMGNYTYGEKEVWYAHSIESNNYVVFFETKDRKDGYQVFDDNGILDPNAPKLQLLDKIHVYNKSEYYKNPATAKPVQIVEFKYSYELCKKFPSNIETYGSNTSLSGKLTLKSIRVQNGTSQEMKLHGYTFEYDSDVNPDFSYANVDVWGNFKQNNPAMPNEFFPYSTQDRDQANESANAWKLQKIKNPIGGELIVEYETDSYSYVQDKKAMRHFNVEKMTNVVDFLQIQHQSTWNGTEKVYNTMSRDMNLAQLISQMVLIGGWSSITPSAFAQAILANFSVLDYLKYGDFMNEIVPNNILVFKLDKPLSTVYFSKPQAQEKVRNDYFKKEPDGGSPYLSKLFLKIQAEVKEGIYEQLPLFADIDSDRQNVFNNLPPFSDDYQAFGVMPPNGTTGDFEYGYVVLKNLNSGDIEAADNKSSETKGFLLNPIQKFGIDYARQNLPDVVYGSCISCDPDLSIDRKVIFGADIYKFMLKNAKYMNSFNPNMSTLSLFEPDGNKYGGGARVKTITYIDNWDNMSTETNSGVGEYTWNYDYGDYRYEISKGHNAMEPRAALDESQLYQWETFINVARKFPDERTFHPTPLALSLYPNALVGYHEVEVTSNDGGNGMSVTRFHTAKSHPTIEKNTGLDKSARGTSKFNPIQAFVGHTFQVYGFTEGYLVETNDFHGKPDETLLYDASENLVSRTKYKYKNKLSTSKMLDRSGNLTNELLGVEYDMHVDSRFVKDESNFWLGGVGLAWTIGTFIIRIGPYGKIQSRESSFYSNVLVKHMNHSAVVESLETEYLASFNSAKNIVYDKFSGNVLLSSLNDEYNDPLYNLTYPSHWAYPELREISYQNGKTFTLNSNSNGSFSSNYTDILNSGDVIKIGGNEYWVYKFIDFSGNLGMYLLDIAGDLYIAPSSVSATVIKSNRKNRLNETMQSIVTKKNPLTGSSFNFPDNDQIISGSCLTYKDKMSFLCTPYSFGTESNPMVAMLDVPVNPYKNYGAKGDLVVNDILTWQSERLPSNHAHGIRFNGTYQSFVPYYKMNSSQKWKPLNHIDHPNNSSYYNAVTNWRQTSRTTKFDSFGNPIDVEAFTGPINTNSSMLFGYSTQLGKMPTAQAVNAKQQDIAYDGFEDYFYDVKTPITGGFVDTYESHFDFKQNLMVNEVMINSNVRHSGLSSLEIFPGKSASVIKKVESTCREGAQESIIPGAFTIYECDCIRPFQPNPGDYVIGVWVKGDARLEVNMISTGPPVTITSNIFQPTGPEIDGWRRVEGHFNTLNGNQIEVKFINDSGQSVFFDDIRIHPFLAGMQTVVYDPKTLLPMATHDGYNFTTFYNYDENLNLVRTRVETERGIMTISETESGAVKN
jgi:hypothetical protein